MRPASQTAQNIARPAPDRAAAPRRTKPLRFPQARLNAADAAAARAAYLHRTAATALTICAICAAALILAHTGLRAALATSATIAQAEQMRGM